MLRWASGSIPAVDTSELDDDHAQVLRAARDRRPVYGVTTAVGHLAEEPVGPSGVPDLVANHRAVHDAVARAPMLDEGVVRLALCVKLAQLRAGGTGITPSLVDHVSAVIARRDALPDLAAEISYSSADVLPGAALADHLIEGFVEAGGSVGPADAIALTSGSHIQVGATVDLLARARTLCDLHEAIAGVASLVFDDAGVADPSDRVDMVGAEVAVARAAGIAVEILGAATVQVGAVQPPVSVRARFATVSVFDRAVGRLVDVLGERIGAASGNPMIGADGVPHASGSFMALDVADATAGLTGALTLVSYAACRASVAMLESPSSSVTGADRRDVGSLGLIQVPKAALGLYGRLRSITAGSTVVDYVAVSHDFEDLGSGLLHQATQAAMALEVATDIALVALASGLAGLEMRDRRSATVEPVDRFVVHLDRLRQASSEIESGLRSRPEELVGPRTESGTRRRLESLLGPD